MRTTLKLATLIFAGLLAVACEQDGPVEDAAESLDDATDELRDAGDNVMNSVEDACEEVKDGMDAADSDC
ncbi:MAG: hypothetical protein KJO82_10325 [Gammaproteobacteria bacterium]|nr:hypothetical protein [Gammaproteobacteria bacterium]